MKKRFRKWFALMLSVSIAISVEAQTTDEFLQLGAHEVQSSARFTGMGGAFNALGGDIGSLSTNPAGLGVYRTSEVSFSPSLTVNRSSTDFLGETASDSRTRFRVPSIGYIGAWQTNKTDGLISLNFALGANRVADFYKNSSVRGLNSGISVLDFFKNHANFLNRELGKGPDYLRNDEFNRIFPNDWSTALAYGEKVFVIDYNDEDDDYKVLGLDDNDLVNIYGNSIQSGGTAEYVLSFGGNISNKFQFGLTVGLQDLMLTNRLNYREEYQRSNRGNFRMSDRTEVTNTTGFGVNAKAGIIYRPFDALRLGFALHSPTGFNMRREYTVEMSSTYFETNTDISGYEQTPTDVYEYSLTTPYRVEAGVAYIIGKRGLLSVDYELVGNNSMRMHDDFGSAFNNGIGNSYRPTSNLRIGGELNLPYGIVLRAGYNYFQSPYKDTKLDFGRYAYSGGFGFRGKNFFADFAFVLNSGKYHYAPYFVNENRIRDIDNVRDVAVETINLGRITATIGFKFQ